VCVCVSEISSRLAAENIFKIKPKDCSHFD